MSPACDCRGEGRGDEDGMWALPCGASPAPVTDCAATDPAWEGGKIELCSDAALACLRCLGKPPEAAGDKPSGGVSRCANLQSLAMSFLRLMALAIMSQCDRSVCLTTFEPAAVHFWVDRHGMSPRKTRPSPHESSVTTPLVGSADVPPCWRVQL